MMGARRVESPHYGMVVTDATGVFMLLYQTDPFVRGDARMLWRGFRLDVDEASDSLRRDYMLLLDPDQFGEVD